MSKMSESSSARDSINNLVLEELYSSVMARVDVSSLSVMVVVWVPKATWGFFFIMHLSARLSNTSPWKGGDRAVETRVGVGNSQSGFMRI